MNELENLEKILQEFDRDCVKEKYDGSTGFLSVTGSWEKVRGLIIKAYQQGVSDKVQSLKDGELCNNCGHQMKPDPLTGMCEECWENG